ncbi:type II 3-dehydroquinate dehydratase [Paraliomyxa miuraensis]|uniref:type II 3-dehydroquinate dehydratase n=1 Tax=Paraliomyxa miuraensis TaxID=376150 RepID=UPI00225AAFB5|nr:type II 3-dehydroquinate dehydratase [Paraliomyxa miuraensis]MCX4240286.1 type II 3-dehydroquinate dehydratase [Paraliomyxa miuraensis]
MGVPQGLASLRDPLHNTAALMTASAASVLVVHGPNLDLLGDREPEVYGRQTLADLDASLVALGERLGLRVRCRQANGEGAIIDLLHEARRDCDGVVINPAGYTHTSVAITDALRALTVPAVEVHLSNLYTREPLRHRSLTGAACRGVIMGLGPSSYHLALRHLAELLSGRASERPSDQPTLGPSTLSSSLPELP